jgi:LPXTG-site transpeptidase (sortase) family protein
LNNDLGYLEETAFPSWNGNSVITGHVYKADGTPGPFQKLNQLKYGDPVHLHIYGLDYMFEVREVKTLQLDDLKTVLKHEDTPWLTLMTCQGYDDAHKTYRSRVLVRAALIKLN